MKYIAKKAATMLITLLVISMLAFLAFEVLPGDPTTKMLGTEWTAERAAVLRHELGLDVPLPLRRGWWPLFRMLAPAAPWVWRAMKLKRRVFR